jgi:formyltetrahydrofolate synthetase
MAVLLKDAVKPTLMQTLEHTPVFVHAGPFANIAHGNNSIIADKLALKLADYVVTESGFGADCGMEKFMDIKCRVSGLKPDCVVIVCSIRALKMHSGKFRVVPGKALGKDLTDENVAVVKEGAANLAKQIENAKLFGVPVVVAVNRFTTDSDKEVATVREIAMAAGADDIATSNVWAEGGPGGVELAEKVVKACDRPKDFKFLYETDWPIKKKIETIATKIYGAGRVEYSPLAEEKIATFTKWGHANTPICMAKTHLSLSHDPNLKGRPQGFTLPIRDVRISAGAGFLYPLCGEMRTMPGLPSVPAGTRVDIEEDDKVVGLF